MIHVSFNHVFTSHQKSIRHATNNTISAYARVTRIQLGKLFLFSISHLPVWLSSLSFILYLSLSFTCASFSCSWKKLMQFFPCVFVSLVKFVRERNNIVFRTFRKTIDEWKWVQSGSYCSCFECERSFVRGSRLSSNAPFYSFFVCTAFCVCS